MNLRRTIPKIRQSVNQSSALLLSAICDLMYDCMALKKSLVDLIAKELDIVRALTSFLDVDLFGKYNTIFYSYQFTQMKSNCLTLIENFTQNS